MITRSNNVFSFCSKGKPA